MFRKKKLLPFAIQSLFTREYNLQIFYLLWQLMMIASLQLETELPAMLKMQTDKMKVIGSFELFYPCCKYQVIIQSKHSIQKISWIHLIHNTCNHPQGLHTLSMMGTSVNKDVHRIGPLHNPVTWYKITHASDQVAQWDFQNKGRSRWTGTNCIVLEVPLTLYRFRISNQDIKLIKLLLICFKRKWMLQI